MVKATVRYTGEHFKAVASLSRKSRFITGGYLVLLLSAVTGWFVYKFKSVLYGFLKNSQDIEFNILIAVIWGAALFMLLRITVALAKSIFTNAAYDKMEPAKQIRNFEITPENLLLTVDGEIEHTERRFILSGLHSAVELREFFILFLYEKNYCIIGKQEITEGSPEELRKLLYDALGSKFNIKK